jgi:8-oxo-dGTP diphosphatase
MRHTSDGVAIDYLALAILRRENRVVLVQQRRSHEPHPYWVIPGGLVEAGELVMDALIREVREEAGVHVTAMTRLACLTQIDRPAQHAQTIAFIFEVERWHGTLTSDDPDAEILSVELVPCVEAISRLQANDGWPGIQEPLLAYLRGDARMGTLWFYREGLDGQRRVACLAP